MLACLAIAIYNEVMGFKVVDPGDRSIEKVDVKLPTLPREEGHRIRRTSRAYFDVMLPEAIRVIQDALASEDMDDRKWAADKVLKATLSAIPNETVDPENTVIDSTAKEVDALKDLEKETENGTGLPDNDK